MAAPRRLWLRADISARYVWGMSNAAKKLTNNELRSLLFRDLDEAYAAETLTQYEYRCQEADIESQYPENDELVSR